MSNNNKTPAIRFKGFTDTWEQRELRTAATFSKGSGYSKNDLKENGTPIILYGRLYTKYETVISEVDTFVDVQPNSVYSTGHEVIVPASGETAEDISRASFVAKSGILLGGDLNIIVPDDYINPVFLALTISNGNQQKELSKRAQGKSVVHIHNSDLENVVLLYPKYEEQEKIGEYFSKLDTLITLHQRKCDKLIQFKAAMLKKMFPQNGADKPELRFKGFTDAWEHCKLNETVKSIDTGKSIFHSDSNNGEYAILGSTSIIGYDDCYDYDGDFILTARVGANAGSLYRYTGKAKISDNTVFIQAEKNIDFVYYMLTKFDIKQLSFGTGQPLVKASELKNLDLKMPSKIEEQQKIGSFFSQLDSVITLHQCKCDKYKSIKAGLIRKLFP